MTKTAGIHHLGLTVPNIDTARDFFIDALGFKFLGGVESYPSYFISDGVVMLTLWQAVTPEAALAFDRKNNIGLHHFALGIHDSVDINALYDQLALRDDVTIEFKPEPLGQSGKVHMMCGIPGNIRLELIKA
jgi:catechol 2,3-dioxygenase-like lactoylglutathione lyase family enzyme